jgi:hypothetical protein
MGVLLCEGGKGDRHAEVRGRRVKVVGTKDLRC